MWRFGEIVISLFQRNLRFSSKIFGDNSIANPQPATRVSFALRARRECPSRCLWGPFEPRAPECPKRVPRVNLECQTELSGIVSCDTAAVRIWIRIVRCQRPAKRQNTNIAKHRPIFLRPLLLVGSEELVLKAPKRGQFHAAIRVTRKRCDSRV